MKINTILLLYKLLREKPNLKKSLVKIAFVFVFFVGVFSVISIWAAYEAYQFASTKSVEIINSPKIKENVKEIKSNAEKFKQVNTSTCLNKIQSYISINPWLEKPFLENLDSIKTTCLNDGAKPPKEAT